MLDMLTLDQPTWQVTPEEDLAAELQAAQRQEYVGGQVDPMPGVSATHDRLFVNLLVDLGSFLEGQPCEVRGSDLKLRLACGASYYYPDLMVCCDPTDVADDWRERPRLVVEITSPETDRTDSIERAAAYYATPSIESDVLISQAVVAVAVHRRASEQATWVTEWLRQPTDVLRLDSLGFSLDLARLYRRSGLLAE